jgi:hypothetical protein
MSLEGLSQEEMVALANTVNADTNDATVSADENDARKAAAAGKQEEPKGSQTAEELAQEAAAFLKKKDTAEEPTAEEVLGDTAEEETSEDATEDADAGEVVEFPQSDDPGLNAALSIMKAAGMDAAALSTHFGEAIKSGDISKVDRAALDRALGADQAVLVMAGVTKWSEDAGREALAAAHAVQESVGGAANWAKMTQWARSKAKTDTAFKSEIEGITDMLNGTGKARELGAKEFQRLYNDDPNNATVGKEQKTVTGDKVVTTTVETMTGTEAYRAKEKATRLKQVGKLTHAEHAKEMQRIQRARNAGRAA